MAGIGFELKKIYQKRTVTAQLKGAFYSIFATIGHVLMIILVLGLLKYILRDSFLTSYDDNLYSEIVVYAFIFPLIFTSGISSVLSRYLADKIYQKEVLDISASVVGVLSLYTLLFSLPGILLLSSAEDLTLVLKVCAYLLYMNMGIIFLLMVYVSALKDYASIAYSFVVGMGLIVFLVYGTKDWISETTYLVEWLILYFVIGTSLTAAGIFRAVRKKFPVRGGNYFGFLLYIKKYPALFVSALAYTLMLYAQNFLFWYHEPTKEKVSVFLFSGDFDLATAFAVYTVLPAAVLFMVRTEVYFYDTYAAYIHAVNTKTGIEIKHFRRQMERSMWEELLFSFEIQGILSLVLLLVGLIAFPYFGVPALTLDVFPFLVVGLYLLYFSMLMGTLMQYFENYLDPMRIFLLGLLLTVLFGGITLRMGKEFYGLGILFSSLATLFLSVHMLKKTVQDIDLHIFTTGTLRTQEKQGKLEKFVNLLNHRG